MNVLSCRFKSGRPQTDPRRSVFFYLRKKINDVLHFRFIKNSFGMLKCLRRIMIRSRLKSLERGAPNSVRYIQMKKGDRIACLRVVPFPVNGKFDVFAGIKIGRNVKENQVNDGGCGAGRLRHDVKRFVSDVIIDSGFVSSNVPLLPKHGAIRDSVFAAKTVVCYVAFGTLRTVNQVTACRCSECVVLKLQPGDVGKIILPQSAGRVGNIKTQSNLDFMRRRRNFFARNFFARNFFARNFFARNFFAAGASANFNRTEPLGISSPGTSSLPELPPISIAPNPSPILFQSGQALSIAIEKNAKNNSLKRFICLIITVVKENCQ